VDLGQERLEVGVALLIAEELEALRYRLYG